MVKIQLTGFCEVLLNQIIFDWLDEIWNRN